MITPSRRTPSTMITQGDQTPVTMGTWGTMRGEACSALGHRCTGWSLTWMRWVTRCHPCRNTVAVHRGQQQHPCQDPRGGRRRAATTIISATAHPGPWSHPTPRRPDQQVHRPNVLLWRPIGHRGRRDPSPMVVSLVSCPRAPSPGQ
jgi:hypothetical protein